MPTKFEYNLLILVLYVLIATANLAAQDGADTSIANGSEPKANMIQKSMEAAINEIERYRSDLHRWDRVVRGFRSDHHLALTVDYDRGDWQASGDGLDRSLEVPSQILQVSFLYTFHLRLWQNFGYFVGTKAGVALFEDSDNKRFESGRYYRLPGLTAGIVWNLSPAFGLYSGIDASLMRVESLSLEAFSAENLQESAYLEPANVTAPGLAYRFGLDFYFQLELGLRIEYSSYRLEYQADRAVGLRRQGKIWTVGLIRHLI